MNATKQLADALRTARTAAAYSNSGEIDLPGLGEDWMSAAHNALAAYDAQTAGVAAPNGKLVGWWNGITQDVTERSPYGPSVRWGADAEDSAHDIPLYDGYNPIHYRQPDALAAVPAASGVHPDALPDGTLSKSTVKRVTALASASVSERARASKQVHDMLIDLRAAASIGRPITGDELHELEQDILRAIEQALTQQRGESSRPGMSYWAVQMPGKMPKLYGAYAFAELNWYPDEGGALVRLQEVERIGEPTTPQPSADAVLELVKRWRECAKAHKIRADRPDESTEVTEWHAGYGECAAFFTDELESLLSAASGEKGVG